MKLRFRSLFALFIALASVSVGCASVDRNPPRRESAALPPSSQGALARAQAQARAGLSPEESGFHLLPEAAEALSWRLALADHATRSIDAQYYLWNRDETGLLMISRLLEAADRGVRVRVLVDNFLFRGEEETLAALCHHPKVEIRFYNPIFDRSGGVSTALEMLVRFPKINRRMHNKALIADNRVAIIGGRNIGNEYFGLSQEFNFVDLDVLAAGPVVEEASASFDRYWNSGLAFPAEAFAPSVGPERTRDAIAAIHRNVREESELLPRTPFPVARRDWSADFASLRGRWRGGRAALIDDVPTADEETGERFVVQALSRIGSPAQQQFLFASPYLIPKGEVHQTIRSYVERGVEVRILTSSMDASDHLLVYSHYRQHRRPLLAHGLRLHEMRGDATPEVRALADTVPIASDRLSLHVKAGVGDRSRCFIGSLNLDPRSIRLNTENGLVIESPGLAGDIADFLGTLMAPENAWEVTRDRGRRLRWDSRGETLSSAPVPAGTSRIVDFFLGLLPIQHLL